MGTRREFISGSAAAMALAWPASRLLANPPEPIPMRNNDHDDGRHDFDFFHGRWQVHNQRRRQAGSDRWHEFAATLDCRPLLGGLGNIDEYRSAEVQGLTLRLFDPQQRRWSDRWVSARDGQLGLPAHGRFVDGIGEFVGEDSDGGHRILSRARWSQITAHGFAWEQAASRDNGASWETNWIMHITRAE